MNWGNNTNISEITKTKSLCFDNSLFNNNIDNSMKNRPITSRINLKQKMNLKYVPKSPKIKNYSFSPKYIPKLFSMNDIKEKYRSKAPNLPNQYKRKIYENINNLLYNKSTKGLLFNIPQIEYEQEKRQNELAKSETKKSKSVEQKNNTNNKLILKLGKKNNNNNNNNKLDDIKKNLRKDKFMPEGYDIFEKSIFENCSKNYINNNYIKINKTNIKLNKRNANTNIASDKDKILIRKLNRLNQYKSQIFNNNINNIDNNNNGSKTYRPSVKLEKTKLIYKKYLDSDIFNLRHDKNILEKSGEYSYINSSKIKPCLYNVNNETLLGWKLRKPLPSFLNYSSSQYSLFNRNMKNNCGKTKEQIINEVKKIDKEFNPTHKQKGLTEFIELSRVSAQNINVDYTKAINDEPNIFKKKNNFSTEFYDLHMHYKYLCDKPFQKFNHLYPS